MKFKPIRYSDLTHRAKENYNFQKVSSILADYGFSTLRLSDDWQGADFIALKFDGSEFIKVQLKGRFGVAKKYEGKKIWVCFPFDGGLYLFPHDEILAKLKKEKPAMFRSRSWVPPNGEYHQKSPDKILQRLLEEYFYQPTKTMPNLLD
jgi:hypothetical protein